MAKVRNGYVIDATIKRGLNKQAQAHLLSYLRSSRTGCIPSIKAAVTIASRWKHPKELDELDPGTGFTKLEQAVRNAMKVVMPKNGKAPPRDAITTGQMLALKDGGVCLPGKVPPRREVHEEYIYYRDEGIIHSRIGDKKKEPKKKSRELRDVPRISAVSSRRMAKNLVGFIIMSLPDPDAIMDALITEIENDRRADADADD